MDFVVCILMVLVRETISYADSTVTQLFGSLHTMETIAFWATKEENMYDFFKLRREKIKQEIDIVHRYILNYEETFVNAHITGHMNVPNAVDRGRFVAARPFLSHQMIERYAGAINDLRKHIHSKEYWHAAAQIIQILDIDSVPNKAHGHSTSYRWPERKDLLISHLAILDIQLFYAVYPHMIFKGATFDTAFGGMLSLPHTLLFGMSALRFSHYFRAVEWFEFTTDVIKDKNRSSQVSAPVNLASKFTKMAIQEHNFQAINWKPESFKEHFLYQKYYAFLHFFVKPAKFGENWRDRGHRIDFYIENNKQYGNHSDEIINMFSVCMGRDSQPQHIKARLHCYLDNKKHPYFILNPLKTEQLSEFPYILQFYDVLGKDTINEMYRLRGEMEIGYVDIEDNLVVRSAAYSHPSMEYVYKIQNRSELLTGLSTDRFVAGTQVAEYVYGRHYKTHKDPISQPGVPADVTAHPTLAIGGDRLATILYYKHAGIPNDRKIYKAWPFLYMVDEATAGGNTAFGEVGISARGTSASAVFWFNMDRNGYIRTDTSHTACPVIHGHKTIINYWFRYNANFQKFKCLMDPLQ